MPTDVPSHGLRLTSTLTEAGELEIRLVDEPVAEPGADEVLIRVEASPINPSDLGSLLGPADPATAKFDNSERPSVTVALPPQTAQAMARRKGLTMSTGLEGAGLVVKAGANAKRLLGKRVTVMGGGMHAQYRVVPAEDCLVLPDDVTSAEGAAAFVNPLTALAMVETMRLEGHKGLVHTAAASNLGQMLVRICREDGVPLVNVVRRPEQAELLRGLGAAHVCDTSAPAFREDLVRALAGTGATMAFDAVGGGRLASDILTAMESAAVGRMAEYSLYGSSEAKQVYIYGSLDPRPIELMRSFGLMWGVGGWLLMPTLHRLGPKVSDQLRRRVVSGLKTLFASHYAREISLAEMLQRDVMLAYTRKATGEKYLVVPGKS
jgi:NADPH:quinone reductase-like Zn-dependent oxidoreductase